MYFYQKIPDIVMHVHDYSVSWSSETEACQNVVVA